MLQASFFFDITSMHIKALWSKKEKEKGPYRVIDTNLFAFISSTRCFPPPLRASLWSSCVVLPLLALTWMSAVLAMTDKRSILFQILFAVFDSLQGFVIVMVHCVLRREVEDDLTFALLTWIYKLFVCFAGNALAQSQCCTTVTCWQTRQHEHANFFKHAVKIFSTVNVMKDGSVCLFLGPGRFQMPAQKLPRPNQW